MVGGVREPGRAWNLGLHGNLSVTSEAVTCRVQAQEPAAYQGEEGSSARLGLRTSHLWCWVGGGPSLLPP